MLALRRRVRDCFSGLALSGMLIGPPNPLDEHPTEPPRRIAQDGYFTTLPPDPVLAALGLPPLRWRLGLDSVRVLITAAGATPIEAPSRRRVDLVLSATVADAPAAVTATMTGVGTPKLTGIDIIWSAPATLTDALPLFNRLLRRIDAATSDPHTVREGARNHQDTVTTLPTGTGLIARHFVVWGRGRRLDADRTMTMLPDGTIRVSITPSSILRERADTDDYIALLMRYAASPRVDEMDVDSLSSPASLSQDLCTSDLPYYEQVHGAPVTFHVDADGAVRSVDAMYSLSFEERVSRTDVDAALLRWVNTCRVVPAVAGRLRVAASIQQSLDGWLRGVRRR